ncbi:ribokinase [Tetragenococcus halophilus subsp. flandriensis]|nr:ribokinase [Tetragenococcus halophilus subsp. flandriensis]
MELERKAYMSKITVLGSMNLDTTIRTERLPMPGETVHSQEMFTGGGGKGANQAIAAARNGGIVSFIGALGDDAAGKTILELLEQDNIKIHGIKQLENIRTGSAYVMVDDKGENSIIIHGGANQKISDDHIVEVSSLITESDYVIAQLETNLSSIKKGFEIAKQMHITTILNPAPAPKQISEELIQLTDILIPNETELEIITGTKVTNQEELYTAAQIVHQMGIRVLIVTLGSKGAFYSFSNVRSGFVSSYNVEAKDTTAAGDTFIGALVTKLSTDMSNMEEAINYGNKASSLTVQRYGAQPSIPYENELIHI